MIFLLDTSTLLWWWSEPERLTRRSRNLITDPRNTVLVSAASAWEVSTKHRIGKYPSGGRVIVEWAERISQDRFQELAITSSHALRAGSLPGNHRDPFDRMIAAQGILEGLPVLTTDAAISELGAEQIW